MLDEVEAGGWTPGQLASAPCPQAVELSLAPGGRLLFVSDLHFTQSGPLADFQAGDALHDLVAYHAQRRSHKSWPGPMRLPSARPCTTSPSALA